MSPKDPLLQAKLSSSSEETLDEDVDRGRPDGIDETSGGGGSAVANGNTDGVPKPSNINELMASWDNKPPIGAKPPRLNPPRKYIDEDESVVKRPQRNDSDSSSSRGRMGSPSGKSHDSSDSETNWSRRPSESSPSSGRRRLSGETRLDRLVRRPSGERNNNGRYAEGLPAPALPKPLKKPKAKPRQFSKDTNSSIEEPLYDTVAPDEIEDEYDNHLLYGTSSTNKTDTIGSSSGGGSSSADLGFDEPLHHHNHNNINTSSLLKSAQSLTGSGTLSSSDAGDAELSSESPSLRRLLSLEEETNYVNIQYFLQGQNDPRVPNSKKSSLTASPAMEPIMSDDEHASSSAGSASLPRDVNSTVTSVRQLPLPPIPNEHEEEEKSEKPAEEENPSEAAERIVMYKCILNSIVESEAVYLEGLSVMLQYMKAMKVTLSTANPVIPKDDFEAIFYRVPELHDLHLTFHESLKKQVERWSHGDCIGHTFKMLASRTKIYAAFLNNYQRALEALHRCTETYPQFADLTRSIKLRTVKGQQQAQSLSLEDLLHKPVARVQKHCLCLKDLIKYTPESHSDYATLNEALSQVQAFVNEYNVMHAGELFPHQERQQRHLVKNSFIVELSEGCRKLRHLFLFNDVLVCAKYKASNRKTEKFTFQLKWYIPLCNVS